MNEIDELHQKEMTARRRCTMADWIAMRFALNETHSPPPRDLETGQALIPGSWAKLTLCERDKSMIVEIDWS